MQFNHQLLLEKETIRALDSIINVMNTVKIRFTLTLVSGIGTFLFWLIFRF